MISIITPTFNSSNTITKNVQSVISQNCKEFEHIIVDNESIDDTIRKIETLYQKNNLIEKLKIISEKDSGISDAFNKGIRASKGDIIAILNSDDEYFDNSIFERVTKAFKYDNILIVHGDVLFIDSLYGSNRRTPRDCPVTGAILYNHPAMFIRKSVYNQLGLYKEGFRVAMDTEFFYRLQKSFKDVRNISSYISEIPLAIMNAGGASWNQELKGIQEMKNALILHEFWNFTAKRIYFTRIFRTKVKKYLTSLSLNFIVELWRKLKWR
ncbi:MAG: glycosyltransferase family 2 protein [Ignavibacteriaceae bacterium]|jgi:glycosyltransferase involved in cell wall biosynthesis